MLTIPGKQQAFSDGISRWGGPGINANGGRDHWPQVSGCILAGGGMNMGQVIGSTSRLGEVAQDCLIHNQEEFATLYRQLGIDVAGVKVPDLSGRPQYLLEHRDVIREFVQTP